jgi:hypothetical protein
LPGSSPRMTGAFGGTRSGSASHTHTHFKISNSQNNLKRAFAPSRREAPEALLYLPPKKGVGNAGCPLHPRPRVHVVVVKSTRVTTSTPESPDVPARNGFTTYFALSSVTGLFCHRRLRIKFCLSPVGPTQLRRLDTSVGVSGPHDFAVRCNISRPRAVDRSQAHHPPCDPIARKTLPRPPQPTPRP